VLKRRALDRLGNRLIDGVITVSASEHRSQLRNRQAAATPAGRPARRGDRTAAAGAPPDPAEPEPVTCVLGPATRRLGGQWLGAPVSGLDDLAAAVFDATVGIVPVTHPQPFQADVVLARGRVPAALAGALAQRAAHTAAATSHVLAGLALLHAAEAHALLGDGTGCKRSLGAAESHFDRIEPADAASEMFTPAQFDRVTGSCYLVLGDLPRAATMLERAAGALHDRRKSRAIVLGNLTLVHLRRVELDAAAATLHEAIDLVETTRGGGGLNVVFTAGRELSAWRHDRTVQDVHDRLLALMAAA
jgi:hypothetical protein